MEEAYSKFMEVGNQISQSVKSQMFGKPCFKLGGKAFVCFFQEEMVFKLDDSNKEYALKLEGAKLFDPSGKGRAMKNWIQVPLQHQAKWLELAQISAKLLYAH